MRLPAMLPHVSTRRDGPAAAAKPVSKKEHHALIVMNFFNVDLSQFKPRLARPV